MPETITSGTALLLHTSGVEVGCNFAGADENYLCKFNDFYDDESVINWFLTANSIVLGFTTKTFQGRFSVASSLRARRHPKSRRIWLISLVWNPLDFGQLNRNTFGAEPLLKVKPDPANLDNPDVWDPVLLRRTSVHRDSSPRAYYQPVTGVVGFTGYAHATIETESALGTEKTSVRNSALAPIANAPGGLSGGGVFTFKVMTKEAIDEDVFNFELSTNNDEVIIDHKGLVLTFPKHCLFCSGISITEQLVNNTHAWSIEINFESKFHRDFPAVGGWVDIYQDSSFVARAIAAAGDRYQDIPGEPPGATVTDSNSRTRNILDVAGRPISQPIPLDGNGRELVPGENVKYVGWRYPHETDWTVFPYFNRILA